MLTPAEAVKSRAGNPYLVRARLETAAQDDAPALSQDDQFLAKWYGLYSHRNEAGLFMLRLKVPGGQLNALQLKSVAKIATDRNRDFADITTRQDIQLHWVRAQEIPEILHQLEAVGITTLGACGDVLRNLVGCPLAGLTAQEYFDATPALLETHAFFTGNPDFANLPRKYKVSIGACREQCWHPEIHCVSFVGMEKGEGAQRRVGFDLRVGGGLSTQWFFAQRLNLFVPAQRLVAVLKAITEIYRDASDQRRARSGARFKYLIADWGLERFRQALQERIDFPLEESGDWQDPQDSYRDHTGVHEQKQPGLFTVGVPILAGRISGAQMRRIADAAERHGDGRVRLTNRQNILMANIPQDRVAQVLEGLESVGLKVRESPIFRGVLACTGIEFCRFAVTETKTRAKELVGYLDQRVPLEEPLRIHVSGCPNTCAQSPIAQIGLQGSRTQVEGRAVESYDVAVGGQLGAERAFNHFVVRKIPAAELKFRLEHLLIGYKRQRRQGESFNGFCSRVGDEVVAGLLNP